MCNENHMKHVNIGLCWQNAMSCTLKWMVHCSCRLRYVNPGQSSKIAAHTSSGLKLLWRLFLKSAAHGFSQQ
jgi:hypothetical protein